MNQTLGNFLLVLGVVLGTVAAADSKRAFRELVLETGVAQPGQYLYGDVTDDSVEEPKDEGSEQADGERVLSVTTETLIAAGGDELVLAVVDRLVKAGHEKVRVRFPALSEERIPVAEGALGRVLAEPVLMRGETKTYTKGRLVTEELEKLAESEGIVLKTELKKPEKATEADVREAEEAVGEPADPGDEQLEAKEEKPERILTEDVVLPYEMRADEYVDEKVLERLQAAEVTEIEVRIAPEFVWNQWRQRHTFVVAVVLTLFGVFLKRLRPSEAAEAERLEEMSTWIAHFDELQRGVSALAADLGELDAPRLHERLDPLLNGPAYEFLEGRETMRTAHGTKAYVEVMGPYASAERKLHRAWSAAVDGVYDEARNSIEASLPYLEETREVLVRRAT